MQNTERAIEVNPDRISEEDLRTCLAINTDNLPKTPVTKPNTNVMLYISCRYGWKWGYVILTAHGLHMLLPKPKLWSTHSSLNIKRYILAR